MARVTQKGRDRETEKYSIILYTLEVEGTTAAFLN
jgi:hypothetical protein